MYEDTNPTSTSFLGRQHAYTSNTLYEDTDPFSNTLYDDTNPNSSTFLDTQHTYTFNTLYEDTNPSSTTFLGAVACNTAPEYTNTQSAAAPQDNEYEQVEDGLENTVYSNESL
jgi:hypothetical protein